MALSKKVTYDNGTTASYHRIDYMAIRCKSAIIVDVAVSSYADAELRGSKPSCPIATRCYSMILTADEANSNLREVMYGKLKQLPEWEGAVDDLEEIQVEDIQAEEIL